MYDIPNNVVNRSVYIGDHINMKCQRDIPMTTVRKTKSTGRNQSVLVIFKLFSDRELFTSISAPTDLIKISDARYDPNNCLYENVHSDFFYKHVFNLSKYTSSDAARFELGRHP